jgi:hypothetical protein
MDVLTVSVAARIDGLHLLCGTCARSLAKIESGIAGPLGSNTIWGRRLGTMRFEFRAGWIRTGEAVRLTGFARRRVRDGKPPRHRREHPAWSPIVLRATDLPVNAECMCGTFNRLPASLMEVR